MSEKKEIQSTQIKLFEGKQVRSVWVEEQQWYFSVVDVVQILTESSNVSDYIKKMRKRDEFLSQGRGQLVILFPVKTAGGVQKINCDNIKSLLRIIQSIPLPKAKRGGNVAGVARKETEKELGHSVISKENYLHLEGNENGTLLEDNLSE